MTIEEILLKHDRYSYRNDKGIIAAIKEYAEGRERKAFEAGSKIIETFDYMDGHGREKKYKDYESYKSTLTDQPGENQVKH
jgi:hypothetical protein